jgi:hypothetical protein
LYYLSSHFGLGIETIQSCLIHDTLDKGSWSQCYQYSTRIYDA